MLANVIEKRPWIIIVAWILIVLVSAPLAANINKVVITNVEKLVPKNVESIKAMDELKSLRINNVSGGADYLIVVENVPMTISSYKVLRPWYINLKSSYNNLTLFSWIDVVNSAETKIHDFINQGVYQLINVTNVTMTLVKSYNKTFEGINGLIYLINATDNAYVGVYKAGSVLAPSLPGLVKVMRALNSSCNSFLFPLAKTYYNIIRIEALLEFYTQAYERGELTLADIAIVITRSANLSDYGVSQPSIPFVALVYNYVKSHGGPLNFSNRLAADLAYEIISEYTPSSATWMLNIATKVWINITAFDGDHRALLKVKGCTVKSQIELWKRIEDLLSKARVKVAIETAESFAKAPKSRELMLVLAKTYSTEDSCAPRGLNRSLARGLVNYLALGEMPKDMAEMLVKRLMSSVNFTKGDAADIASRYVVSKIPEGIGLPPNLVTELPEIVTRLDPNATGVLSYQKVLQTSVEMLAKSMNLSISQEVLKNVSTSREGALLIFKSLVARNGGERGTKIVDLLERRGLLGANEKDIRKELPDLLATLASETMNVSKEKVLPIAEAATEVYFEGLPPNTVVATLTDKELRSLFPNITDELKGALVSKDLNGFIISVTTSINNTKDLMETISSLSTRIADDLKSLGFTSASTLYGGEKVISYESKAFAEEDIKKIDKFSVVLTLIILGLLLESIVATVLPYIGIGLGLITALATTYLLAKLGVIDVSTHSRVIMFTTGLGLGIDYAGYVAKRFREEAERLGPRKAAAEAFRRSWRPVIAGAITASIGFGSMILAGSFKFITTLGTNIPIAILLVMIASITFIPALLAYVGETSWFWWPSRIETRAKRLPRRRTKERPSSFSTALIKRSAIILAVVVVVGVVGAIPVIMFSGSYDPALELPEKAISYHSLKVIESEYDPGILYPIYVIASNSTYAKKLQNIISSNINVSKVEISSQYKGDRVLVVTLSVYPMSKEGMKVAEKIRDEIHRVDPKALVGGEPVVYLDIVNMVHKIFYHKVYPVALLLMFITMWIMYGGMVLALAVIASVVLGAVWGIASTIGVYQYALGKEVIWMLPIVVFTAILGVGMDYNSFFLARAREECEKKCSKEAVAWAISKSSGLVLGLASAMAGAYIGIAFSSTPSLSVMGTALTLGVVLTGVNASLLITPLLLALLGRRAWWPSKVGERD